MLNLNKTKTIFKFVVVSAMFLLIVAPTIVAAQSGSSGTSPVLDLGLDEVGSQTGLGKNDVRSTIGSLINVALGFLGVVAVVIVLIGGFKYMIAGGNDDKVGDAKKWIMSGIIGLAIILSAYAITSFVIDRLITATGDATTNIIE